MTQRSLYRTPQGEGELNSFYDRALARLGIPYDCQTVQTRYGHTHVLLAGPQQAEPLVLLHGAYDCAPSNLKLFLPLAREFRIYALDTIGQSVRSAQAQLSLRDNSYGVWVADVLAGLGLERVPICGTSFGAGIALRALVHAPQRFSSAALVVPSGIANGPLLKMAYELFLPWILYFLAPSRARLFAAAAPMMTELDEDFLDFIDAFLRNVRWKPEGPRLTTRQELQNFTAPTLIFVTDNDCFFPGDRVERKAREIFPNLVAVEHLHGRHLPSKESMHQVTQRIITFLHTGQ
jgi:pimeloyl-ACP methyl ester carboxylesterase